MIDTMNKVSARDVASEAGVSAPVVSWVANGTATQHRIGEATQCRVRAVIERMGYGASRGGGAGNLTTALAALGWELVPVTSVNDLTNLPGGRLVGVVYEREVRNKKSEVSWSRDALVPEVTEQAPELRDPSFVSTQTLGGTTEGQGVGVPAPVGPEPEVTPQVVPPVDADVPAASVTVENPPGTDGAGLPAVATPQALQAGTSPSTLVTEPVVPAPVVPPVDTDLRAASVTVENPPGTDGDGTSPSTLAAEPVVPAPVVPPVDADVTTLRSSVPSLRSTSPAASVTSENPPGTDGAQRSPSTLTAEPVVASTPPSTTQQPSNPTTVLSATVVPDLPNSSCLSCPSMLELDGNTGERDSNIDRQDVQDRIPVSSPVAEPVAAATVVPDLPNSSCLSCPSMLELDGNTGERDSNIDRQDVQDRIPISSPMAEPVAAATVVPDLPNSSCLSCPSMLNPSGNTGERDSNIDRQDVQDRIPISSPVVDPPVVEPIPPMAEEIPVPAPMPEPVAIVVPEPEAAIVVPVIDSLPTQAPVEDAAGTAATTEEVPVAVESSTIPPSTTQQPDNPATERESAEKVTA